MAKKSTKTPRKTVRKSKRRTAAQPLRVRDPLDRALEMTFPASDPVALGQPTSTEAPGRPIDRQAPLISREDVERASRPRKAQAGAALREEASPPLTSPVQAATQQVMQLAVLPWVGWTAVGLMLMSWPFTDAMNAARANATDPIDRAPQAD